MDPVEEIKSRLSIEDVVGDVVELKRSGSSYKGLCPFHNEKTPSFYVTPSRGSFHCFGCGKGGDIFTFVMETQRVAFPEALTQLAEQAGVYLPEREPKQASLKSKLYEANEGAASYFGAALMSGRGEPARGYLKSRRFGESAVSRFTLGYAPDTTDGLISHLRNAGFEDRIILAAGLAYQDDIGGRLRDRFRGRLMFPIRDAGGRISGFGGRILGDGQPKYLNSPQTEIFDKSGVLFGIHLAADSIRQAGRAVLVEGYLDAVRAHLGGYMNTVASLGTAVTTQQLLALSRLTDTVILALDPDPAGQSAAARTSLSALAAFAEAKGKAAGSTGSIDLRIARLPDGEGDPDELIGDNPSRWEEILAASIPAFEFYFTRTVETLDRNSPTWRQEAIDTLLPVIQQFAGSTAWVATWMERLSAETGISAGALQRAMPSSAGTRPSRRQSSRADDPAREVIARTTSKGLAGDVMAEHERALLALLLRLVVLPQDALEALQGCELSRPEHRVILENLLAWAPNMNYDYDMFRETLPAEVALYADELHGRPIPLPDDGRAGVAVDFHLTRMRQARLLDQFTRVSQILTEIDPADRASEVEHLVVLMRERAEIDQALERLSQAVAQSPVVGRAAQGTIDQESGSL